MLNGDGTFPLAIVGESRYQHELETISGERTESGVNVVAPARLVLEDNNPYNRKAVRAEINGMTVGFLDKPDARAYRRYLKGLRKSKAVGLCQASIRGGWKRSDTDQGYYGVWLDFRLYG